ncbi:DinB family protein [Pararhodonellum marinum]|uniref:DinB family protein n=1 Tax=Pararhodonellum marinum TaxID=2755358 RepID=UPI001890AD24|nr:DinB family protein [Pararhodonellum marinum]
MKALFKKVFKYHHETNQKLIQVIEENQREVTERTFELYAHILNAHQIWMARIMGRPERGVFERIALNDWQRLNEQNYHDSLEVLEQVPLEGLISYRNSRGVFHQKNVVDILFHVGNHTTHHRGQVISDLRSKGITPPVTDYIFYEGKP